MSDESYKVELPHWMWKHILGEVRNTKHTAFTGNAKNDARLIEKAIVHQIEAQAEGEIHD